MLGMGKIVGPNEYGIYVWKTRGFEETQSAIALLWRYLGPVKRAQAAAAIREVLDGYRSGRLKARPSRRASSGHTAHAGDPSASASPGDLERAWAAGFMDAEGCFGLARSMKRKKGPQWYRIRVSATQHGEVGIPAEVLKRLHAVFGGIGRIERHGDPDDYRWLAEGTDAVEYVLRRTEPWLGSIKVAQAKVTLEKFRGQVRLKGDATRCVRGHIYSGLRCAADDCVGSAIPASCYPKGADARPTEFHLVNSRTSAAATLLSEKSPTRTAQLFGV